MASDIILETQHLKKEFKGFVAVNDINLKIKRGTIYTLIGPNGAGKTTVFNLLTKFLPPTTGRILYNGRDITAEKPPKSLAAASSARSRFLRCCSFILLPAMESSNTRMADPSCMWSASWCPWPRYADRS
jgi:ABC-type branched-subunit amino acid transport system ATPase component